MKIIPITDLQEGMIPRETIYTASGTILISSGHSLNRAAIDKLLSANIASKSITICEQNADLAATEPLSQAEILTLQTEQVLAVSHVMLYESDLPEIFGLDETVFKIDQMIQSILENPIVQQNLHYLLKTKSLSQHSLHVAILAIHMGIVKGYNYMNLDFLGTCALLHDIGQAEPLDMLKKLNTTCIKNSPTNEHALAGYWALREIRELNILAALVALQHHEHFDGLGTPFGLSKFQITEFARLIAVADVYANLIYVLKNTRLQAIAKILERSKTQFDPEMVTLFEKAVCK